MFRNYKESFPGRRKTIPEGKKNHGPANHQPDVPKVNTHPIREIIFVPKGAVHDVQNAPARKISVRDPHQPITPGKVYFPEVKEPIGNGGGTSKEALARAKKLSKKKRKR